MLSEKHIAKYQTLYRERFGEVITREEAKEQGEKLLRFMRCVLRSRRAVSQINENEYESETAK